MTYDEYKLQSLEDQDLDDDEEIEMAREADLERKREEREGR